MAAKVGTADATFHVGSSAVDRLYIGSTLAWDGGAPPAVTNSPAQPFTLAYTDDPVVADWGHPGALIVAGRSNYASTAIQDCATAGATVLAYVDAIVWNTTGTYHDLLFNASAHGSAVPEWPGPITANGTGNIADFREGSVMHSTSDSNASWTKLEAVLEQIVSDNPHISGFFADDVGSRSYFGGASGSRDVWGLDLAGQEADYRAGAIAVTQTLRRVCDRHGLILVVNGTWQAGTLTANGGGYPDLAIHGCSLAEGGVWEHHDYDAFGDAYMTGAQWADAAYTAGTPFCLGLSLTSTDRDTWVTSGALAYVTDQADYNTPEAPWGSFHATGLPPA